MAAPFATATDLTDRGVTVTNESVADVFLEDASEFLRGEIGWQVYPTAEVTVDEWLNDSRLRLPGSPIRGVSAVAVDGVALGSGGWELVGNELRLGRCGSRVQVTYTVGWDAPPAELVSWTCVLAADSLDRLAKGLGGALPQSLSVDDVRVQFSTLQQAGEPPIPPRVLQRLKATYGAAVFVT